MLLRFGGPVGVRFAASSRWDTPESAASIEAQWSAALGRGLPLFDGAMCRLERFAVGGGRLTLALSETSYRVFLGTNLHGPRSLPASALANPVGVSPALVSGDGKLLLGRRNGRVAYYPHRLHPFSGSLEPARLHDGASVEDEVRRELREELNLQDVAEVTLLGIVEDRAIRHPELIFVARTPRPAAEVLAGLDRDEHVAAVAVDATPAGVAALPAGDLTPVAAAAVGLYLEGVGGPRFVPGHR